MSNANRYRGFEASSPYGELLIKSANIIDLAVRPEQTTNRAMRTVVWTDNYGVECRLQAQQKVEVASGGNRSRHDRVYVEYLLSRKESVFIYDSDKETVYVRNDDADVETSKKSRLTRINLMLETLGTFKKDEVLAKQYEYWESDIGGVSKVHGVDGVNQVFQEIVTDNQEFDRKIGKTVLGRTSRITPRKLREVMPHIDDHMVARYMSDVV